jgi:hypothetical protein
VNVANTAARAAANAQAGRPAANAQAAQAAQATLSATPVPSMNAAAQVALNAQAAGVVPTASSTSASGVANTAAAGALPAPVAGGTPPPPPPRRIAGQLTEGNSSIAPSAPPTNVGAAPAPSASAPAPSASAANSGVFSSSSSSPVIPDRLTELKSNTKSVRDVFYNNINQNTAQNVVIAINQEYAYMEQLIRDNNSIPITKRNEVVEQARSARDEEIGLIEDALTDKLRQTVPIASTTVPIAPTAANVSSPGTSLGDYEIKLTRLAGGPPGTEREFQGILIKKKLNAAPTAALLPEPAAPVALARTIGGYRRVPRKNTKKFHSRKNKTRKHRK